MRPRKDAARLKSYDFNYGQQTTRLKSHDFSDGQQAILSASPTPMILFTRLPGARIWTIATVLVSALIVWNSHLYFDGSPRPRFFYEKGAVAETAWWRAAFYFHVIAASGCLLAGIPLMFPAWTKRHPQWHRNLGYFYINAVLWVAVPTGMILATVAKGGWLSSIGFGLAGVMWGATTWVGYTTIRAGQINAHIRAMIRSYCWALSAPIFRLIQLALLPLELSDDANYVWSLWLSSAAAVVLAETCLWRTKLQEFSVRKLIQNLTWKGALS